MNYDVLKSDRVLIWYDGPMVEVLRDGMDYYMTYMTDGCICARIKKADLIAVLKNEQPMNYVYENAPEKFEWDMNLQNFKKVSFFKNDDLFDANVYAKDLGIDEKSYINELKQRR